MAVKSVSFITGLTVAEEQAAIKWLEELAVWASKSEQKQAKNALRIIKGLDNAIKALNQIPTARAAA